MSEYFENIGQLENIKQKSAMCEGLIQSYKESIRRQLPLVGEACEVDGEFIVSMAIALNEKCLELRGYHKKIAVLERAVGR